ncbi:GTP-binding protein [Alkalibacterium putridalgicola]|uniref:GTPase Obg n=2 Tax=Alkalibacterium putridalgicola TaxID=426703 RepID=A0A1H7PY11_9LACT|nr:GTPase Obg [Alkalibacterium putridalgicola]SEL40155.1 GTP-binding protein [Alkalibacterium putridalgicola]
MSMFLDQVKVNVKAGNGGDGMVAFRREKYVPDGGPAGGDGGEGGDVIFIVDEGLRTLMDFRYNRHFKAEHGENGMSKGMHGRGAKDLFVKVPPGTIVKDAVTGTMYADLTEHDQKAVIAKGGRGGRGNIRFASPRNPAPEIAENGEPGEEKEIELELKVLADVGLIGFPSVGKSTLLSVVSAARPKIGAYHFTTLVPNLGMVKTEDGRSFVLADMPGLIEGASQGVGLGIEFLRHIERTRVLLHVIDMSGVEGRDPVEDYYTINQELEEYDLKLRERPQLVIANKMDMPDSQENLANFRKALEKDDQDVEIFEVSALTQTGLNTVMSRTAELLETTPEFPMYEEETEKEERVLYKFIPENKEYAITREPDGTWVISGDKVEKLYQMTNFQFDESVMRFARQLRGMGIDQALRDRGARNGDTVRIDNFEFDFVE